MVNSPTRRAGGAEDTTSCKTADVVCQDVFLMPQMGQKIDEDFVQDAVQLVQLSETILKIFADSNKDLAQVQQIVGQRVESMNQMGLISSPGSSAIRNSPITRDNINARDIHKVVKKWKEQYEKQISEMQHKFTVQHNHVIADYKKLDRDYNEALQDKISLEDQLEQINHNLITV